MLNFKIIIIKCQIKKNPLQKLLYIKEFLLTALSYKYFYIASILICLAIAFVVNKFSPTVYGVNSIIGPIEDKRPSLLGSNNLFSGVGDFTQIRNLENDINSLNSFSLVSSTIKTLNLEVGYFSEKKMYFQTITSDLSWIVHLL